MEGRHSIGRSCINTCRRLCLTLPNIYTAVFAGNETVVNLFGENLNFFHSVFVAAVAAVIANILVSKCTQAEPNKSKLTWVGLVSSAINCVTLASRLRVHLRYMLCWVY